MQKFITNLYARENMAASSRTMVRFMFAGTRKVLSEKVLELLVRVRFTNVVRCSYYLLQLQHHPRRHCSVVRVLLHDLTWREAEQRG